MKINLYVIASAIVWAAIIAAAAVVLRGTPYLGKILPILGGGAVWFVIITPAAFRKKRPSV